MLEAILAELSSLADEKYRRFNESLTPGTEEKSIGVRMGPLRKIAHRILSENPIEFLDISLSHEVHEVRLLHAIVLAKSNESIETKLKRLQDFVPTIDNWAVCDLLCNDLKPSGAFLNLLLPLLQKYAQSDQQFEVRFAYVMLMLYCRTPAHIDKTFSLYARFHHEGYYARMGVAWGLSYLYVDYPERTIEFLKTHTLDPFTHNKTIQKIIESLRVSDAEKQLLRTLRR